MPPVPAAPPERMPIEGVKNLIVVASGKGGVGKTTVAVNLAIALSRMGSAVGLLDADVYGPNVPLMLGTTEEPRATSERTILPVDAYGLKIISMGLLSPGDKPIIWRGPMLHQIIRQFLQQVEWGNLDYLVVDLPPGTGDVVISLVQTVPLTGAIVVSTGSSVAAPVLVVTGPGFALFDLLAGCFRPLASVRASTFGISERASRSARTLATVLSVATLTCLAMARLDASGFALSSLAMRSRFCSAVRWRRCTL